MSSVLSLLSISLSYGLANRRLEVFSSLSADFQPGECVAIVGPSGCGKSSLLSIIAGHRNASAGDVIFQGTRVRGPHRERQLMQQQDSLLPHLTVEANLELAQTAMKWSAASAPRRWAHAITFGTAKLMLRKRTLTEEMLGTTQAAIDEVGLNGFGEQYPKALSGGMRRRAELARCLLADGQLLLLDEPFTGLDAIAREQMHELVERVWIQKGRTCIVVTHDWNEAVVLADRVIVLSARPAKILSEIQVDLPRPRGLQVQSSDEFIRIADSLHRALRHES